MGSHWTVFIEARMNDVIIIKNDNHFGCSVNARPEREAGGNAVK